MKKISVVFALLLLISGCGNFDVDMMLCEKLNDSYRYEVQYKKDKIHRLRVVRTWNYEQYNDEYYEARLEEAKQRKKDLNNTNGLTMDYTVDEKIVITTVSIDYDEYDIEKDKADVIPLELHEDNFKSIENIREVFVYNGYTCDEIVERN